MQNDFEQLLDDLGYNFITIDEPMLKFLEKYNLDIVRVPADGHCFIHAVIESLASPDKKYEYPALLKILKDDSRQNIDRYVDFFDDDKKSLLQYVDKYFDEKH